MKIYYIENKLQIYAKLNSSRKLNITETRISIVTKKNSCDQMKQVDVAIFLLCYDRNCLYNIDELGV